MGTFFVYAMSIFALALATMLLFLVGAAVWDKIEEIRAKRQLSKLAEDLGGITILSERLENQRKQQLRHIKERDAADQDILDRAEEARRDFD